MAGTNAVDPMSGSGCSSRTRRGRGGTRNGPAWDPQRPLSLAGTDFHPPTGQTSWGRYPPDWRALSAGQWALRQVLGGIATSPESKTVGLRGEGRDDQLGKLVWWTADQQSPMLAWRPGDARDHSPHPPESAHRTYQRDLGEDPEARRA